MSAAMIVSDTLDLYYESSASIIETLDKSGFIDASDPG